MHVAEPRTYPSTKGVAKSLSQLHSLPTLHTPQKTVSTPISHLLPPDTQPTNLKRKLGREVLQLTPEDHEVVSRAFNIPASHDRGRCRLCERDYA